MVVSGQRVGRAGGRVSLRPGGGAAGVGGVDDTHVKATRAGPQGKAVTMPAGEVLVVVATEGNVGTDGADAQQFAGCVCERRHVHIAR